MHPPLQFTLEAHATAATLYVDAACGPDDVVRALRHCYALPAGVRHLLVDLRRAYALDPGGLDALAILLQEWRAARGGTARVNAPEALGQVDGGQIPDHGAVERIAALGRPPQRARHAPSIAFVAAS